MFRINDALRHTERRLVFNVDGLRRLAAQSVYRSPADIIDLVKLAEGGFNRTFLITMRDGFKMVARIPYPATVPKYYAVASEVATMDLRRSSGLPTPKVYGYSPEPDNVAGTEYIFMEFIQGTKLSNIWRNLGDQQIISVLRQLTQLESKMMSIPFPAGGSLYYPEGDKGGGNSVRGRAFLRWSRYKSISMAWQEITARCRPGTMYAAAFFLYFIHYTLEPIDNYRQKRRSSACRSSPQGTGLPRAV